jgi:hypothetical protein
VHEPALVQPEPAAVEATRERDTAAAGGGGGETFAAWGADCGNAPIGHPAVGG